MRYEAGNMVNILGNREMLVHTQRSGAIMEDVNDAQNGLLPHDLSTPSVREFGLSPTWGFVSTAAIGGTSERLTCRSTLIGLWRHHTPVVSSWLAAQASHRGSSNTT